MRLIGLTGGYASGKTLVASAIERRGGRVIDLDDVSRTLSSPGGGAIDSLRRLFGEAILTPDGGLDRQAMGKIIFADPEKRRLLETTLHPLMRIEAMRQAERFFAADPMATVVIDGALLFEGGWYKDMTATILVTAPIDLRIQRGMARDRITEEEVRGRFAAQWGDDRKRELADFVIDNSGTPETTLRQVEKLWPAIVKSVE